MQLNNIDIAGSDFKLKAYSSLVENKELTDLIKLGLVNNDVINFSKDSFIFETDNVILPKFIYGQCTRKMAIVSLDKKITDITGEVRKKIENNFSVKMTKPIKSKEIYDILNIDVILSGFISNGQDGSSDRFKDIFVHNKIFNSFRTDISLLANENNDAYLKIVVHPNLDVQDILDEYMQAVLFLNKIYRIKLDYEKLSYCPVETEVGKKIVNTVEAINKITSSFLDLVIYEFLNSVEEVTGQEIDEYGIELFRIDGISLNLKTVSYFQNVIIPDGKSYFCSAADIENSFYFGLLNKEFSSLPQILDENDIKNISEQNELLTLVSDKYFTN